MMLDCIPEATGTFIPVSSLLLDMKELRGRPDGGVGKAVNLFSVKQVCFLAIYSLCFYLHVVLGLS